MPATNPCADFPEPPQFTLPEWTNVGPVDQWYNDPQAPYSYGPNTQYTPARQTRYNELTGSAPQIPHPTDIAPYALCANCANMSVRNDQICQLCQACNCDLHRIIYSRRPPNELNPHTAAAAPPRSTMPSPRLAPRRDRTPRPSNPYANANPAPALPRDDRLRTAISLPYFKSPLVFYPPTGTTYRAGVGQPALPRRYVSVELEIAGIQNNAEQLHDVCKLWNGSCVSDGSLPMSGFEINTSPAKGAFFEQQIREICAALKASKAFVNYQCGLHAHIDSRDMSDAQVLRLIEVYARIEDGLYLVVPDSRRRNADYTGTKYCEKCAKKLTTAIKVYLANPERDIYWGSDTDETRKRQKLRTRRLLRQSVYGALSKTNIRPDTNIPVHRQRTTGEHQIDAARSHYHAAKYFALNLHAHFYRPDLKNHSGQRPTPSHGKRRARGTIETRLAAGTTDPEKIIPWVKLWDNIFYVATGWPTNEINRLPKDPYEALLAVAPDIATANWLNERKTKFADHQAPPVEDF